MLKGKIMFFLQIVNNFGLIYKTLQKQVFGGAVDQVRQAFCIEVTDSVCPVISSSKINAFCNDSLCTIFFSAEYAELYVPAFVASDDLVCRAFVFFAEMITKTVFPL